MMHTTKQTTTLLKGLTQTFRTTYNIKDKLCIFHANRRKLTGLCNHKYTSCKPDEFTRDSPSQAFKSCYFNKDKFARTVISGGFSSCRSYVRIYGGSCRYIHRSSLALKNDSLDEALLYGSSVVDVDDDEDDTLSGILDSNMYTDQYLYPNRGHKVFIIHPDLRSGRRGEESLVSPEHHVAEARGLIDALPGWSVVQQEVIGVRQFRSAHLFTKGVSSTVKTMVQQCRSKTAVLVNMSMLTGLQLSTLQGMWNVPVYDRYTIILQIFRLRARTKEVKLQLALAEIPYYRSRMRGMHQGSLKQQEGGLHNMGGTGDTWMQTRYKIMSEKEQTIKKKLLDLKNKRQLLRQERKKRELPMVAVVGYTNAGKTSLIKALTRSETMRPWDQVFATLDVTCHAGYLGNHMKVVYVDTVGFISEIPTSLIESFSATLEDAANADVIVHVRDASHPDHEAQKQTVMRTLTELKLQPKLMQSIIEVNNKIDLLPEPVSSDLADVHHVSMVTGEGIPELLQSLEDAVITNTGRINKWLKIPQAGPHLGWLFKEATVTESRPCDSDSESILVHVTMTCVAYNKFCARFTSSKQKKHK